MGRRATGLYLCSGRPVTITMIRGVPRCANLAGVPTGRRVEIKIQASLRYATQRGTGTGLRGPGILFNVLFCELIFLFLFF